MQLQLMFNSSGGNEASFNGEEFRRRFIILSEGLSLISCDYEDTCSVHAPAVSCEAYEKAGLMAFSLCSSSALSQCHDTAVI